MELLSFLIIIYIFIHTTYEILKYLLRAEINFFR